MSFKGKTAFITGASRGIGKAIGLRLAQDGANIVIAAKTVEPHPKLEGTIYTAAEEMEKAGGQALAIRVDVRFEDQVYEGVQKAVEVFGGIDILVNNASAISLTGTLQTPMKRYDLMHQINARGTFLVSQACIPHLLKAENPHVLNMAAPLNMESPRFGSSLAYTMAKYGMGMCVLGMAEEFKKEGVAFNALWPKTGIKTAAIQNLLGGDEAMKRSRDPEIMSDAAAVILARKSRDCTGNFFIDEDLLRSEGVTDFKKYGGIVDSKAGKDFFLDKN